MLAALSIALFAIGSGTARAQGDRVRPTIQITSPSDGADVQGAVTFAATASDNVGVVSVTFRVDGTIVGRDMSAPYSVSWNASTAAAGSHTLTAEAVDPTDNPGIATIAINVGTATANQPPTVTLTAPTDGATFAAPASITLAAEANDSDGTIVRVDLYSGTEVLRSDTTAPYTFTWSDVPAGVYSLSAVAHDSGGQRAQSSTATITIANPQMATTVTFNASSNHNEAVTNYLLEIFTEGSDPKTATAVQTQNLGKPNVADGAACTIDIRATIVSLPSGTYIATVTAIGPGGSARSGNSSPFTR